MGESQPTPEPDHNQEPAAPEPVRPEARNDLEDVDGDLKEALDGLSQLSDMIAELEVMLAERKADGNEDPELESTDPTVPGESPPKTD